MTPAEADCGFRAPPAPRLHDQIISMFLFSNPSPPEQETSFRNRSLMSTETDPKNWRRGWDLNPRYGFPHTRFPSVLLRPLGHLSATVFYSIRPTPEPPGIRSACCLWYRARANAGQHTARPQPDGSPAVAGTRKNSQILDGGEGGIRTHGPLTRSTVFETVPFNRSGTSPRSGPSGSSRSVLPGE
jgi:hypothetical protein